jgi:hypothetical protein
MKCKCKFCEAGLCQICGRKLARGITVWLYGKGYAHPECVEGKRTGRHIPIDHGD